MVGFSAVENGELEFATPFLVKLANGLDLSGHSTQRESSTLARRPGDTRLGIRSSFSQTFRGLESASARPIAANKGSSSKGFKRSAIGSDFAASDRVCASLRPVISMVGRLRPDFFRISHISIPVISGRSMSTTMQALDAGISLASNSDGLLNVWT